MSESCVELGEMDSRYASDVLSVHSDALRILLYGITKKLNVFDVPVQLDQMVNGIELMGIVEEVLVYVESFPEWERMRFVADRKSDSFLFSESCHIQEEEEVLRGSGDNERGSPERSKFGQSSGRVSRPAHNRGNSSPSNYDELENLTVYREARVKEFDTKMKVAKDYKYEGNYNDRNQRHGQGKADFGNGDSYEGMYENGKRNGYGVYRFANGAVYEGEWRNGKKHEMGTYTYPDASTYEGEWRDDMRSGHGKYYYVNGDFYDGDWLNHVRHGTGKYIYASSGLQYFGAWKDGKRDGEGEVSRVPDWTPPAGASVICNGIISAPLRGKRTFSQSAFHQSMDSNNGNDDDQKESKRGRDESKEDSGHGRAGGGGGSRGGGGGGGGGGVGGDEMYDALQEMKLDRYLNNISWLARLDPEFFSVVCRLECYHLLVGTTGVGDTVFKDLKKKLPDTVTIDRIKGGDLRTDIRNSTRYVRNHQPAVLVVTEIEIMNENFLKEILSWAKTQLDERAQIQVVFVKSDLESDDDVAAISHVLQVRRKRIGNLNTLIQKTKDIKEGDQISYPTTFTDLAYHSGIVESVLDDNMVSLISHAPEPGAQGCSSLSALPCKDANSIRRDVVDLSAHIARGVLYRVDHLPFDCCFSPDLVVRRAQRQLGNIGLNEEGYRLLTNNCQHFASWCKTDCAVMTQF